MINDLCRNCAKHCNQREREGWVLNCDYTGDTVTWKKIEKGLVVEIEEKKK